MFGSTDFITLFLITKDPALADQRINLVYTVISVHKGDEGPFATGRAKFWLKF
jgi:hypothetical protein